MKNFCKKTNINLKFPNDILINKKKVCGLLQETIIFDNKEFLIIGIGVNIISNPIINEKYQATNILSETKKKPKIKEIIDLIILSYEKFFVELNAYSYLSFKRRAESLAIQ